MGNTFAGTKTPDGSCRGGSPPAGVISPPPASSSHRATSLCRYHPSRPRSSHRPLGGGSARPDDLHSSLYSAALLPPDPGHCPPGLYSDARRVDRNRRRILEDKRGVTFAREPAEIIPHMLWTHAGIAPLQYEKGDRGSAVAEPMAFPGVTINQTVTPLDPAAARGGSGMEPFEERRRLRSPTGPAPACRIHACPR